MLGITFFVRGFGFVYDMDVNGNKAYVINMYFEKPDYRMYRINVGLFIFSLNAILVFICLVCNANCYMMMSTIMMCMCVCVCVKVEDIRLLLFINVKKPCYNNLLNPTC